MISWQREKNRFFLEKCQRLLKKEKAFLKEINLSKVKLTVFESLSDETVSVWDYSIQTKQPKTETSLVGSKKTNSQSNIDPCKKKRTSSSVQKTNSTFHKSCRKPKKNLRTWKTFKNFRKLGQEKVSN